MTKNRKKLGLALGSGSARGWAHIGVINSLLKNNVQIDYIAGTSIGAFVGAFYATGEFEYLKEFALRLEWRDVLSFFDVRFPNRGFLDGTKINELISKQISDMNIEDTMIPFVTVATELNSGKEVRFSKGNIVDAVRASISIPGVFTPFKKQNNFYVDGGLTNPIPISAVRQLGADIILAVDLTHDIIEKKKERRQISKSKKQLTSKIDSTTLPAIKKLRMGYKKIENSFSQKISELFPENNAPNIFEIIANSINIMESQIAENNLKIYSPEFIVRPNVGNLGLFDFDKAELAIKRGEEATDLFIPELKAKLME